MKYRDLKFRKNWGDVDPRSKPFRRKDRYQRKEKHRRDWRNTGDFSNWKGMTMTKNELKARLAVVKAKADIKLQPSVRKALKMMLEEIFRMDREGAFNQSDNIDSNLSCFKNPKVGDVLVSNKKVRAVVEFDLF